MSYQTALAFFKKLNVDSVLLERVSTLKNLDPLLEFASDAGFSFTADEWRQVISGFVSGELTEDDLNQVAAGTGANKTITIGGARGESKDDRHKEWIEIVSYSLG
jgi:predicted ribosomally synthesized peptide with nif11-like leader